MLESKIQADIRDYLIKDGWFIVKLIQCSKNGLPDQLMIKNGRMVFCEVKQPGRSADPLQAYRIKELKSYGVEAFVAHSVDEVRTFLN